MYFTSVNLKQYCSNHTSVHKTQTEIQKYVKRKDYEGSFDAAGKEM
jgi:hypothetical protein